MDDKYYYVVVAKIDDNNEPIAVFNNSQLAMKYRDKCENVFINKNAGLKISYERWLDLMDELWNYEMEEDVNYDTTVEGVMDLHPELHKEDIEAAENMYDVCTPEIVYIVSVPFIKTVDDFNC